MTADRASAGRHAGERTRSAAALREDTLTVAGIRSPLLAAGPRDATEAVVFVHGNPGSREDWRSLVEKTGAFARAVAWDHPGYGRAERPPDFDYTVAGYAAHLGRCLDALGVERAHLVLHDFGGPWGLTWAAQHPARFASATLVNIGILRGYRWHYLARIWRTPVVGELVQATTTRAGLRLLLRHGNPRGLPAGFIDRIYDDLDRGMKRAMLRLYRATDDLGALTEQLHPALRPLDRPALVVWGRHDPYVPVAYAERQRETFPRAEVVVLDDSGHWPFVDNAPAVERTVTGFLRRTVGATGRR